MKKRKYLLIALMFIVATILASIPMQTVKASDRTDVRFYVWNSETASNIYGPWTPGFPPHVVEVWIDSPDTWDNTASGIVGYAISLQVDPTVLTILTAEKIPSKGGFLEDFLHRYWYDYMGYSTSLLIGGTDPGAGLIWDVSEMIMGWETLGKGAGGGPIPLLQFVFVSQSDTAYSPIEILDAYYYTPAGKFPVEVVDSGHYNAPPAPEFPLGAVTPLALIAAVVYVWMVRKRKPLEVR